MNPMSSALHQINVIYIPEEDRLLMRAKGSDQAEYRIWLTRRFCQLLLGILGKQIDKVGGLQQVSSSEETRDQLKQGAMEKAYRQDEVSSFPLGEKGILAYRINTSQQNEQGSIPLELLPQEGPGLTMNLDKSLLFLMFNLLEQGVAQAHWNIEIPSRSSLAIH